MPSRDSTLGARVGRAHALRQHGEFALRVIALAALVSAVLVVAGVFSPAATNAKAAVLFVATTNTKTQAAPLSALVQQIVVSDKALSPLHVVASAVPSDTARALLSAARSVGVPISWTDSTHNAAVAIEATAQIDPRGGIALRAAAPNGAALAFRDSLGLIDSVQARGFGAAITVGRVAGSVAVTAMGVRAQTVAPAPVIVRRILLVAEPGWEAKFTSAALEERGWIVDARYQLGKNVSVSQGTALPADTARYAAVIVLDSAALPHIAAIRRYVQNGGGVLIAGAATTLREFGDLLPAVVRAPQAGVPGALGTDAPQQAFPWRPLLPDSDALVIARSTRATRGGDNPATIVAKRYGAGRVVEVAYSDVWQWRMAGPDGSVDAHRRWWSNLVSMVAYAPPAAPAGASSGAAESSDSDDRPGNAAPYADMIARFGKSAPMPVTFASENDTGRFREALLLVVAVVSLLLEWTSRRLRGAR
ncbi:MAG: hypothetical protein M3Y64_10470 [Gemmatimonadota bacterium]|nr:hypothetical protein [Gemmatimonadota bacterium]